MKNNIGRGFTLIELLAVILILGVISLIAIPIINKVLDKANQSAYKQSAIGLVESADIYYTKSLREDFSNTIVFTIEDGEQTSTEKLLYSGKISGNGEVNLYKDGKVSMCIDNGKYYATKSVDSDQVKSGKGTCGVYNEDDGTYAVIDLVSKEQLDMLQKELDDLRIKIKDAENGYQNTDIQTDLPTDSELVTGINNLTDVPDGVYYYDSTTSGVDVVRYKKVGENYFKCDKYGVISVGSPAVDVSSLVLIPYNDLTSSSLTLGTAGYVSKEFILGDGADNDSYKKELSSKVVWTGQVSPQANSISLAGYEGYHDFKIGTNIFFIPTSQGGQRNGGYDMSSCNGPFNFGYNSTTGVLTFYSSTNGAPAGEYDVWTYVIGSIYLVTMN